MPCAPPVTIGALSRNRIMRPPLNQNTVAIMIVSRHT